VGIDLDDQRLIGASAAADLMTDEEIQAVLSLGWASEIETARNIVFLAKEALFKYQYPLAGNRDLDFPEVRVRVSPGGASLIASPCSPATALDAAFSRARIQYQEIQQLRMCWVLADS
jgi:4'-phosphopantetheinyl transferase EntD